MFHIRVERLMGKDIEAVFEALSDHAGYEHYAGVKSSVLVETGERDKNGTGAVRHVQVGLMEFHERITDFERPTRIGYRIMKSSPLPIRHERGGITLTPEGGSTRVVWESVGRVDIPVLGGLILDKLAEHWGIRAFHEFLKSIESAST
jgi:uncharacterized protein YndB with AHSA1/START domain